LSALLSVLSATAGHAQVLGPSLESGSLELGYAYKWFHRDLESLVPEESRWETASLFFRYGAFGWVTLSFEGGIWNMEHDDFPGQYYRRYTVGAGASVDIWSYRGFAVSGSFHYSEIMDHDKSEYHFHKRIRSVIGGLFVETSYASWNQTFEMWGGLLYGYDEGETYAWGSPPAIEGDTDNNVGAGLGVGAVLFEHFVPFAQVVYIEYPQARVGFSLRLERGES
jgi:hypothetical protein